MTWSNPRTVWIVDGVAIVAKPGAESGDEPDVDRHVRLIKHCSIVQPPGAEHRKGYVSAGTVLRLRRPEADALIAAGAAIETAAPPPPPPQVSVQQLVDPRDPLEALGLGPAFPTDAFGGSVYPYQRMRAHASPPLIVIIP
jgi:hypothetical protein